MQKDSLSKYMLLNDGNMIEEHKKEMLFWENHLFAQN